MRWQHVLLPFSTLSHSSTAVHDGPGLGISLSSGYATVSARFSNGSYIDIAKIEGGDRYKAHMLGSSDQGNTINVPRPRVNQSLAPMLKALVATAETALETNIHSIAVSAYDPGNVKDEMAQQTVESALKDLGVYGWDRLEHGASQLVHAFGKHGTCSDPYIRPDDPAFREDPERLIMTVEYTRESMTAILWMEQCGVVDAIGRASSGDIGHNALSRCTETADDPNDCYKRFKAALSSVSEPHRTDNDSLDSVIVFGELADEDNMTTTLRQVLEKQFTNGGSVDFMGVRKLSPDPAFAGSRAMALTELGAKELASGEQGFKKEL